jgi:putative ABC transport system permease protein
VTTEPLVRVAARLVPQCWREAVVRDLTEEARSRGRDSAWVAFQVVRIGLCFTRRSIQRTLAGGIPMRSFQADVRDAWRAFVAGRASTLGVVLVLAIGTGLTSAMFALADPFLWRPLPFADPDRLVIVSLDSKGLTQGVPVPTLADWRQRTDLFEGVAATGEHTVVRLDRPGGAIALTALGATANLFAVLGVRTSWTNDWHDVSDRNATVVALLDGGRAIIAEARGVAGSIVPVQGGGRANLVGVLPPWFAIPTDRFTRFARPDALVRMADGPIIAVSRWTPDGRPSQTSFLNVVARVRPGVTPAALESALAVPLPSGQQLRVSAIPARDLMTSRLRALALGAFSAGMLILVISAANIANLMIARGVFRERELATRQALGATRWDLARLMLTELFLTAAAGSAAGLGLTAVALTAVASVMPVQYAALGAPALTLRVVSFAVATAVVIMAFGLLASVALRRVTPRTLMWQHAASETRIARTTRFVMAAAQCAVAMVLVGGAGLLIRSYMNLTGQDTGYGRAVVAVTVSSDDGQPRQPGGDRIEAVIQAFRRLPGVTGSAAAIGAMADGWFMGSVWRMPGGRAQPLAIKSISSDYLETAGHRLIAGRPLTDADTATGAILVNRRLASALGPPGAAVGQQIQAAGRAALIVGVVEDSVDRALDEPPDATAFRPLGATQSASRVTYVVRTERSVSDIRTEARRILAGHDPSAVVTSVARMHDRLADSVRDRSFATLVLVLFAAAAVVVSLSGIVAIVLFVVARRTKEVAIRVALGATPGVVRRLVVTEVLGATAAGLAVGLLACVWVSRSIEALLFKVPAGDPASMIAAASAMTMAATIAAVVPARRATKLQPAEALRRD